MWVLILFMYAGIMSKGDSVALTSVTGFTSEATCKAAGNAALDMKYSTFKDGKFVCVRQ